MGLKNIFCEKKNWAIKSAFEAKWIVSLREEFLIFLQACKNTLAMGIIMSTRSRQFFQLCYIFQVVMLILVFFISSVFSFYFLRVIPHMELIKPICDVFPFHF